MRLLSRRPSPATRRGWLASICLAAIAASVASAQPRTQSGQPPERDAASTDFLESLGRRGDLTLRDATLESALFTISELWNVNIVAGDVKGEVNGVFKDAPLRDILDSILLSNGYAYRPLGGSLVVSRLQDLGQINPFFVSATIPVGTTEVGEAVEAARLMSTPQGQVRALPSAGALLVVDFPDRVDKIRKLVEQLEAAARGLTQPGAPGGGPRQLEVAYFRTHYVDAVTAGQALDVVLSTDGRVATIKSDDRLLVVDYPENLAMVRSVLSRIDRPRPQVNIKALIYDIGLSDAEELGINWDGITNGTIVDGVATSDGTGLRFQTQTKAPFDSTSTGGSFTFYNISSNVNIQAIVLALQEAEDSRLLADPNVTVMDNEQANIESVQEIPFQQLTQTGAGGNIGTTAFKPVGIKLDVTPKIANDHTIDMTVVPEFSRLTGFTPGDNQPIIDTRKATTRVRVANGQTLMIAGLRQRNDVGDFDGIPLLKDVRFVGHLFRSRSTQIEESELVVFITPEIVGFSDPLGERDQLSADTIRCRLDHIPAAEGCPSCGPCASPGHPAHGYGGTTYQATEPVAAPEPAPAEAEGEAPELNPPTLAPQPETVPSLPEAVEKRSFQDTPAERPVARAAGTPTAGLNYPDLAVNRVRRLPPVGGNVAAEADAPASRLSPSAFADAVAPERAMRVAYDSRFRAKGGLGDAPESAAANDGGEGAESAEEASRSPNRRGWDSLLFWR